ncbi:hypothetical protein ACR6C2_43060 [Streptomyces sp. INA 01156]
MTTEDPPAPQPACPLGRHRSAPGQRAPYFDARHAVARRIRHRAPHRRAGPRPLHPADGRPPLVVAEDRLRVRFTPASRVIEEIESTRPGAN